LGGNIKKRLSFSVSYPLSIAFSYTKITPAGAGRTSIELMDIAIRVNFAIGLTIELLNNVMKRHFIK
jgi:hypothetical protein